MCRRGLGLCAPDGRCIARGIRFGSVGDPRLRGCVSTKRTRGLHSSVRLVRKICPRFSISACLGKSVTPIFFNSTLGGFKMGRLLSYFVGVTPSPHPMSTIRQIISPRRSTFSNFIFGVRTGVSPGRHDYVTFIGVYSKHFRHGTGCGRIHFKGVVHFDDPATFVTRGGRIISRTFTNSVVNLPSAKGFGVNSALASNRRLRFGKLPDFSPRVFGCVRGTSPVGTGRLGGNVRRLVSRNITRLFAGRFGKHGVVNAIKRLRFRIVRCHLLRRCNTRYG